MMESLEIPRFWSLEEEEGEGSSLFPSCNLLPDAGLDDLLDNLTSDFLFKPTDDPVVDAEPAFIGDLDDWLDMKMDLSILDYVEDQNNPLNDPSQEMIKDSVTDLAFSRMEKLHTAEIQMVPSYLTSYTPPSSPEGQVPDTSRPINITSISKEDHNMFSSNNSTPPESPGASTSSVSCPLPEVMVVHPVHFLQVVIDENFQNCLVEAPKDSAPQVSNVSSEGKHLVQAKRATPYSKSEMKGSSSVLKSRVKLASGSVSKAASPPKTKRERKRVQNKDAATRYRQKKRKEVKCLGQDESVLLGENQKLTVQVQQLSTEISYLKGLMREMFRARGLLK